MISFYLFLFLFLFISQNPSFSADVHRDIPQRKADPPKLKPIPVLPRITHRVFFNIDLDGEDAGTIVFGLFGEIAPMAVENFRSLALCNKGKGKITGKDLCYKGSKFHRVYPNYFMQGGDFTHGDGTGGESIYGEHFKDESFEVPLNRTMLLAMSNRGKPDSNGSQFFINTGKLQWLNNKHVAFGMVLEGRDIVERIERRGTYGGIPTESITISDCGEHPLKPEDKEIHYVRYDLSIS